VAPFRHGPLFHRVFKNTSFKKYRYISVLIVISHSSTVAVTSPRLAPRLTNTPIEAWWLSEI
jgi:hypothetical protein